MMEVMPSMCFCSARKPRRNRSWKSLKSSESTPPSRSRYSRVSLKGALSKLMLKPGESASNDRSGNKNEDRLIAATAHYSVCTVSLAGFHAEPRYPIYKISSPSGRARFST
jgi:hypothetical protein